MRLTFEDALKNGLLPLLEEIAELETYRFVLVSGPKPDLRNMIFFDARERRDELVIIDESEVHVSRELREAVSEIQPSILAAMSRPAMAFHQARQLVEEYGATVIVVTDPPRSSDEDPQALERIAREMEGVNLRYSDVSAIVVMISRNLGEAPPEIRPHCITLSVSYPSSRDLLALFPDLRGMAKDLVGLPASVVGRLKEMLKLPRGEELVRGARKDYLRVMEFMLYEPKHTWSSLGGGEEGEGRIVGYRARLKAELRSLARLSASGEVTRVLFYGPEGMGKTAFADAFVSEFDLVSRIIVSQFLSQYVGESEKRIRRALNQAASYLPIPTAILVEDMDQMVSRGDGAAGEILRNLRREFVLFVNENDITIVATINDPASLPDDLKAIFDRIVPMKPLSFNDDEGRVEFLDVLRALLERHGYELPPEVVTENVPQVTEYKRPLELERMLKKGREMALISGERPGLKHVKLAAEFVPPIPMDATTRRIVDMMSYFYR